MNPNKSNEKEARLHARLTAEAAVDRPEFSERLHRRIMQSVSAAPRPPAPAPARRRVALGFGLAGLAASAALVLGVWLARGVDQDSTAEQPSPPRLTRDVAVEPSPEPALDPRDVPEASPAVATPPDADRVAALVDTTFTGSQWAYLDHDIRLMAGMVLDHIPFEFPEADAP